MQLKVKPYHRNPRQITKKKFDRLADTLARLGDLGGIVHNVLTDEIIGGNQRTRVFGEASKVEIIERLDAPDEQGTIAHGFVIWRGHRFAYRQVQWDEITAAEANISANIGAGDWNWDILANEWPADNLMQWGFDGDLLGGWKKDIAALGNLLESETPEPRDAEPQIDRAAELLEKWQVKTGDLWRIGEHRLLCGDSTRREDVERAMQGEKADMVFTDPPWNVDYVGGTKKRKALENDNIEVGWDEWLTTALANVRAKDNAPAYIFFGLMRAGDTQRGIEAAGWRIVQTLVWVKQHAQFGNFRAHYKYQHEPIYYCSVGKKVPVFYGANNETSVWVHDRAARNDNHPTEKPIELAEHAIRNSSQVGNAVFDCFCGGGTTIVACQNLGRKCRAIEISPAYCAVTLERMATAFPGIEIERIASDAVEIATR